MVMPLTTVADSSIKSRPPARTRTQATRCYDGFSPDEVATMLQVTGRCDALAGYEFKNVQQLTRDYEAGVFAPAFAPRRGPQR